MEPKLKQSEDTVAASEAACWSSQSHHELSHHGPELGHHDPKVTHHGPELITPSSGLRVPISKVSLLDFIRSHYGHELSTFTVTIVILILA